MTTRRITGTLLAATTAAALAAGCVPAEHPEVIACGPEQYCEPVAADEPADDAADDDALDPCTVAEQKERDDDCGYFDDGGTWRLYPWVVRGRHSVPKPGWTRPTSGIHTQGPTAPRQQSTTGGGTRTSTGGGSRTSGGGSKTSGGRR
jgi:uncharacterized membrane protein YgcG